MKWTVRRLKYSPPVLFSGFFLIFILHPSSFILSASSSWQEWTEASWTQNLGSGLDAGLRFEHRWEKDISNFSYDEIEPMLAWRYSPRWDFALGYERDERIKPQAEVDRVPNISATLKIPRSPFRMIPTLDWMLSSRFRMDFMVPENNDWQPVFRNRTDLEARWKWGSKELLPFVFEEWFLTSGDFFQNRLGIGMGIPIVPHWLARIYWMRLDEKTADGWEWHPVVGFQIQTQF